MERWSKPASRRGFVLTAWPAAAALLGSHARAANPADPWSKSELMEPSELAQILNSGGAAPRVYCVAFPVLFRGKHIAHATFAGPGNKPAGIAALRAAVADVPKDARLAIYCGCCPMKDCPNIRPAYRLLKELGFKNLRVLRLPTNLYTDWVVKAYPVESGA